MMYLLFILVIINNEMYYSVYRLPTVCSSSLNIFIVRYRFLLLFIIIVIVLLHDTKKCTSIWECNFLEEDEELYENGFIGSSASLLSASSCCYYLLS